MTDLSPRVSPGSGFVEVADRVWVSRHEYLDISIGLVGGSGGLLVVDTGASEAMARRCLEDARALGAGEVVAVVNTHEHFDHTFGNAAFGEVPVHAHEEAAARTVAAGERTKREYADAADDPHREEVLASRIVPASRRFASAVPLRLGDRLVELVHPGRGHTGGDAVVRVPDADVLFAGDLVEESALRGGVPWFGEDSHPLEWPATLDLVVGLLTERSLVVPGHGQPVRRDFVIGQRDDIGVVAETIRSLAAEGVGVEEALDAAEWPYPRQELVHAVRRGYAALPPGARRLPLA